MDFSRKWLSIGPKFLCSSTLLVEYYTTKKKKNLIEIGDSQLAYSPCQYFAIQNLQLLSDRLVGLGVNVPDYWT